MTKEDRQVLANSVSEHAPSVIRKQYREKTKDIPPFIKGYGRYPARRTTN